MTTDPKPLPENNFPESATPETPNDPDNNLPEADDAAPQRKQRILIGSQRDPGAAQAPKKRDWYVPGQESSTPSEPSADAPAETPPVETRIEGQATEPVATEPPVVESSVEEPPVEKPPVEKPSVEESPFEEPPVEVPLEGKHFPPPNIRDQLPPELEAELEASLGDVSLDELMTADDTVTSDTQLEPESKHTGRVIALGREDVFVELGSREQGIVPLKQFEEPPEVGTELAVSVVRFNREEGLYELRRPGAAADVADWADIEEGTLVEARITGHNTGGLECEVNRIRGFIPVSQISLYRVEDLAQFVDEKMACLVTEANPERRNLVLSRRAVLEREREEARQQMLASLEPGQVHEGVVRKLMDFGAFVDLGGVDGLLHISELGWGRVNHPSEVLQEGQGIKVKVLKCDPQSRRISLGYRDMLENPWEDVDRKFPVNTVVKGQVVKIMEFGAFVELEPGIEGLVHISELDHKHVQRVGNVVSEGQEVEVLVKSIDKQQQRISLSMKDAHPMPEDEQPEEEPVLPAGKPSKRRSNKPLKGGLGRSTGGGSVGLNW